MQSYHFVFKLNSLMNVNLTFYAIYFSDNILNCQLQNITISNYYETVFCGHMSTFSFYPNYTKYIVIEFLDMIPHGKSSTVNILFYLIDIGVITNIPTPQLIDIKPILIYKINSDHFVKVYYVNVKKKDT